MTALTSAHQALPELSAAQQTSVREVASKLATLDFTNNNSIVISGSTYAGTQVTRNAAGGFDCQYIDRTWQEHTMQMPAEIVGTISGDGTLASLGKATTADNFIAHMSAAAKDIKSGLPNLGQTNMPTPPPAAAAD